jgi:hypothetical protein
VLSVALGRTLVPLPPWDVGFSHLFQPITNCSLKAGQSGGDTSDRGLKPGQSGGDTWKPGQSGADAWKAGQSGGDTWKAGQSDGDTSERHELGEALSALSGMFLHSGAPHEKLHPLEMTLLQVMQEWPDAEKNPDQADAEEREERRRVLKGRPLAGSHG